MAEKSQILWNSPSNEKSHCCETHLGPLLEKINQLEARLLIQTERRENQYNELLRMFIIVKKDKEHRETVGGVLLTNKKRENSKGARTITAPSARKQAIKIAINRRASAKNEEKQRLNVSSVEDKTEKKENSKKIDSSPAKRLYQERIGVVEQGLTKQRQELEKMKQLNDYLMGKLLGAFQKMRRFQDMMESNGKNGFCSQETVTSVVLQNESRNEHIKIINKQNIGSQSRLDKSGYSKMDMGELASKVAEHETVLSDLIQLTRNLSSQIKNLPPEWSISSRSQL